MENLTYVDFCEQIKEHLIFYGANKDDAEKASKNFKGLYVSPNNYKPPLEIVDDYIERKKYLILPMDKDYENWRKDFSRRKNKKK